MNGLVKMYRIMDGERVPSLMPVGSVDRALKKGYILEESAQKLEMPMEILQVMGRKRAELEPEPEQEVPIEMPSVKTIEVETPTDGHVNEPVNSKKPMGRPKRK
jgi:hypothetical protein